jgi:SHS2 domain-containing protein
MSGGFEELENITADLGIKAWGPDLVGAFSSAARGLACLLSDQPSHKQTVTRQIRIEAGSLHSLLIQFLNEIIYLEETEDFLPGGVSSLTIRECSLDAVLTGDTFDPRIHNLRSHIKAATYHGLEIKQTSERVTIKVIFDV